LIQEHLKPLFLLTKSLKGNADLTEGVQKPSYSALWEILIVFDIILDHFEQLETRRANTEFDENLRIESSITYV